jgi:hypothetical protein
MDRRLVIGGGLVVAALLGLALIVALAPDTGPDVPEPAPRAAPRPVAPDSARVRIRPPKGVEAPEPPDERPEPAKVTPDLRREMNYAMDGVIRTARRECVDAWVADAGGAELVFDAVLYDGRLVDFGLRSLGEPLPDDVVACVADAVWYGDWPEWDLPGEMRLQRSVELEPPR